MKSVRRIRKGACTAATMKRAWRLYWRCFRNSLVHQRKVEKLGSDGSVYPWFEVTLKKK